MTRMWALRARSAARPTEAEADPMAKAPPWKNRMRPLSNIGTESGAKPSPNGEVTVCCGRGQRRDRSAVLRTGGPAEEGADVGGTDNRRPCTRGLVGTYG